MNELPATYQVRASGGTSGIRQNFPFETTGASESLCLTIHPDDPAGSSSRRNSDPKIATLPDE